MYAIQAPATCTPGPLQTPTSEFNAIRFSFINDVPQCQWLHTDQAWWLVVCVNHAWLMRSLNDVTRHVRCMKTTTLRLHKPQISTLYKANKRHTLPSFQDSAGSLSGCYMPVTSPSNLHQSVSLATIQNGINSCIYFVFRTATSYEKLKYD